MFETVTHATALYKSVWNLVIKVGIHAFMHLFMHVLFYVTDAFYVLIIPYQ